MEPSDLTKRQLSLCTALTSLLEKHGATMSAVEGKVEIRFKWMDNDPEDSCLRPLSFEQIY